MANSLRSNLLPLLDKLRGLPGQLGFRQYKVWVRTTEWSGSRPGQGTKTVTDTRLLVGNGQDPKVEEVRRNDVVAGIKELVNAQYDIGPLTPKFAGGGVSEDTINPQKTDAVTETLYVLKGPGMPPEGLLCERIADHVDRSLRIVIRVQSIGRKAA